MSQDEKPIGPEELRERQNELAVLERLEARGWSITDPSSNTVGNFVRLLDLSGDQVPYTEAVRRLIRRGILKIVYSDIARKHALTPLGRLGEDELKRLRELYADPKALLTAQLKQLSGLLVRAEGALDDPAPMIRRAREVAADMQAAVNRL